MQGLLCWYYFHMLTHSFNVSMNLQVTLLI